jgi:hypothetical protein
MIGRKKNKQRVNYLEKLEQFDCHRRSNGTGDGHFQIHHPVDWPRGVMMLLRVDDQKSRLPRRSVNGESLVNSFNCEQTSAPWTKMDVTALSHKSISRISFP